MLQPVQSESLRSIPSPPLDVLPTTLALETKLIAELTEVVLEQREAIANDDTDRVDDTVFRTHRILLTLEQVRTQRHHLSRLLGHVGPMTISDLEASLGSRMTPTLRTERDALRAAAARLAHEVGINRKILHETLKQSDSYIRALLNTESTPSTTYTPEGEVSTPSNESMLSRMG